MEQIRKPFQGVWNIIRFNWHFYLLAIAMLVVLWIFSLYTNTILHTSLLLLFFLVGGTTFISLLVSCYVYDFSRLYQLSWLDPLFLTEDGTMVNIHAGFDETSFLLQSRFVYSRLIVLDFYDPAKHTEVSIKRARKAYPPFPGTQRVKTTELHLKTETADTVFAILSAHEIRNEEERVLFFKELKRILKPGGQIIVTEHLRNLPNFLAYTIGFFHFHSRATWLKTFSLSGLAIKQEFNITPFIKTFILTENGTTA